MEVILGQISSVIPLTSQVQLIVLQEKLLFYMQLSKKIISEGNKHFLTFVFQNI